MNELSIVKHEGGSYIDSREIAELIGKRHNDLLRDIRGYIGIMEKSNVRNFALVDFFLESSYQDVKGETRPCYLLSKMGCEMVANKLTGEKGVLFTAAYVAKFNEMELREKLEAPAYRPRLGEYNSAARLIVPAMRRAGVPPVRTLEFLRRVYEPLGIAVLTGSVKERPRSHTAQDIAKLMGVLSLSGRPHYMAVSAVIALLNLDNSHRVLVPFQTGAGYAGVSVQYDDHAAREVKRWFDEQGWPLEIACGGRVFKLRYAN